MLPQMMVCRCENEVYLRLLGIARKSPLAKVYFC